MRIEIAPHSLLLALVAAATFVACGDGGDGGDECGVGQSCPCTNDLDCPDPSLEFCDIFGGMVCTLRDDAGTGDAADVQEDVSDSGGDDVEDTAGEVTDTADAEDATADIDDTTDSGDAADGTDSGDDTDSGADTDAGDDADADTGTPGICGDGTVDDGEACDDGNEVDDDECSNDCEEVLAALCRDCESDDECGRDIDLCVALPDGSVCGVDCAADGLCPTGYVCEGVRGGAATQCVPEAGVCVDCLDEDDDGYGLGPLCLGADCNDDAIAINPEATEICDGEDNDCDGFRDNVVGSCTIDGAFGPCAAGTRSCEDGAEICVPDATAVDEVCGNGIDEDCNGTADDLSGACVLDDLLGPCADGALACDGDSAVCEQVSFAEDEVCDGADNDCNGTVDDVDGACTIDGALGPCASGSRACEEGAEICVQDTTPSDEICGNDIDEDCSGTADDLSGECTVEGALGPCAEGSLACDGTSSVCQQIVFSEDEVCDGVDNDCSGEIDDIGGICSVDGEQGLCAVGERTCDGDAVVCTQVNEPVSEICGNGIDEDCNGTADDPGGDCTVEGALGPCATGVLSCDGDETVCEQVVFGEDEVCDGADNDCSGTADDLGGTCAVDGELGLCAVGTRACDEGSEVCTQVAGPTTEICGNGLDEDCDGTADNLSGSCTVEGASGPCAEGRLACDGDSVVCEQIVFPEDEVCDGVDNDCSGTADDLGGTCTVDGALGLCATGSPSCDGDTVVCDQVVEPSREVCGNGLDEDCDGTADNLSETCDIDDLRGPCSVGELTCDGSAEVCNQVNFPEDEVCDLLDNDCTGIADDVTGACVVDGELGVCAEGVRACDRTTEICEQVNFGSAEICGNEIDEDCNGTPDDPGGACTVDGVFGPCAVGVVTCDGDATTCQQVVFPDDEVCDGEDNDCSGVVDDIGGTCAVEGEFGLCAIGARVCDGDSVVCTQVTEPSREVCGNGLDEDCDGTADNLSETCDLSELDGPCSVGALVCDGSAEVCNQVNFPEDEVCDLLDNDCTGIADDVTGACTVDGQLGVCAEGVRACDRTTELCEQVNFASSEICGNGVDEDCSGAADDLSGDCTVDGLLGPCAVGALSCDGGAPACDQVVFAETEVCDGEDNDCSGVADDLGVDCTIDGEQGICALGALVCGDGGEECAPLFEQTTEICINDLDDDCDGEVDEPGCDPPPTDYNPWVVFLRRITLFDVPHIAPADGSQPAIPIDDDGLWIYYSPVFSRLSDSVAYVYQEASIEVRLLDLESGERTLIPLDIAATFVTELAYSPDGTELAYAATVGGSTNVYVLDLETETSRQLTFEVAPNSGRSPVWSPDGDTIYYVQAGFAIGDIYSMPSDTGAGVDGSGKTRRTTVSDVAGAIDISYDGDRVLFSRIGTSPWSLNTATDAITSLVDLTAPDSGCVYFASGTRVACARGTADRDVVVVDSAGGAVLQSLGSGYAIDVGNADLANIPLGF